MDTDVGIAGAGPVGLLLAAELCLAGVRPIVLERLPAPSEQPKARGIGVLAAEALRRRGLGPALDHEHDKGLAALAREHGTTRTHFAWIHKIDPDTADPGRHGALIGQPALERLLRGHLAELGVEVHFGHTVTGWAEDPDSVTLTLDTPTGTRRITAGHVAGCDGGHSTIRKLAGFGFPGTAPLMTVRYAQARVRERDQLPPPGRLPGGTLFHEEGVVATFDFTDPTADRSGALSADEVRESVRRVTGVDVVVEDFQGGLRFTDQARQVDAYRRGRTVLAGDAAHVHSPNGGQGLNLGLTDAVNLGWKLAATVRGADDALLDSYTAERHPVGAAVLHNTRAQSALLAPGAHVDALRDIMGDLMDLPEVNRYLARLLSGVGHRYPVPDSGAHPLVGTHCPPLTVGGAPLEQLTTDGRPLLIHPAADGSGLGDRVKAVRAAVADDERLSSVLVRPDGVIAWAAAPGAVPDHEALRTAVDHWFPV
ncbi:FAD-dependent monooxygenase [Hamadaea tsunoensis]|uniref:FAD-dependent monooxygenase n=1 Tax=Hamadaea tsunoensis TaxID=53368 RepID=UPI00041156B1|nr:FAD-dependent monooxygenase [Hamadaea tsunoensis]